MRLVCRAIESGFATTTSSVNRVGENVTYVIDIGVSQAWVQRKTQHSRGEAIGYRQSSGCNSRVAREPAELVEGLKVHARGDAEIPEVLHHN
jgi:hypothetical protein